MWCKVGGDKAEHLRAILILFDALFGGACMGEFEFSPFPSVGLRLRGEDEKWDQSSPNSI